MDCSKPEKDKLLRIKLDEIRKRISKQTEDDNLEITSSYAARLQKDRIKTTFFR